MNKLKELRESRNLTQRELSELTGLSLRTIQHYEPGSRDIGNASAVVVQLLAIALSCTMESIIKDSE